MFPLETSVYLRFSDVFRRYSLRKECPNMSKKSVQRRSLLFFSGVFSCIWTLFLTNTPRGFYVETTWKRSFPRRFNVESTWCVCRPISCKGSFIVCKWTLSSKSSTLLCVTVTQGLRSVFLLLPYGHFSLLLFWIIFDTFS